MEAFGSHCFGRPDLFRSSNYAITVTVHLIDSTRLPEPTAWRGIAY
jgi:hypothetical protein